MVLPPPERGDGAVPSGMEVEEVLMETAVGGQLIKVSLPGGAGNRKEIGRQLLPKVSQSLWFYWTQGLSTT